MLLIVSNIALKLKCDYSVTKPRFNLMFSLMGPNHQLKNMNTLWAKHKAYSGAPSSYIHTTRGNIFTPLYLLSHNSCWITRILCLAQWLGADTSERPLSQANMWPTPVLLSQSIKYRLNYFFGNENLPTIPSSVSPLCGRVLNVQSSPQRF